MPNNRSGGDVQGYAPQKQGALRIHTLTRSGMRWFCQRVVRISAGRVVHFDVTTRYETLSCIYTYRSGGDMQGYTP